MEKLQDKFIDSCNRYVKQFCDKHELSFEFWVGDDVGGIAVLSDYFVRLDDIRFDIDKNLNVGVFEEWYDYTLTLAEAGLEKGKAVSLRNFSESILPYGLDDIETLKNLKEKLNNVTHEYCDFVEKLRRKDESTSN